MVSSSNDAFRRAIDRDAFEEDSPRPDRRDPYLRLACVNIFVKDQDHSLRFYVDQLGFNLVGDERYESGGRWVAVASPHEQAALALVSPNRGPAGSKIICQREYAHDRTYR